MKFLNLRILFKANVTRFLTMEPEDTRERYYEVEKAIDSFKKLATSLSMTLQIIETHMTKSLAVLGETISAKRLLEVKLARSECQLANALEDANLPRADRMEIQNLNSRINSLIAQVRTSFFAFMRLIACL